MDVIAHAHGDTGEDHGPHPCHKVQPKTQHKPQYAPVLVHRQGCNPMVMWGRYRKGWFRTTLPVSFQFHHVQMDGGHAATFLEALQRTLNAL